MEYEPRQYFKEHECESIKGFTVLEAKNGRYHIAEKWLASEDPESSRETDKWMNYWVPESDFLSRVEADKCEPVGKLTDEQYEGVCKMVGWRYDEGETPAQKA